MPNDWTVAVRFKNDCIDRRTPTPVPHVSEEIARKEVLLFFSTTINTRVKTFKEKYCFTDITSESVTLPFFASFLEEFMNLHYVLEAISKNFSELGRTCESNKKMVLKHVIQQLDFIVEHGTLLILLQSDMTFDLESSDNATMRIFKSLYTASNYGIKEFVIHGAVQSILNHHGLKTMAQDYKYAVLSPFFYVFYPLFFVKPFSRCFNSDHIKRPIIDQRCQIWIVKKFKKGAFLHHIF